MIRKTADYIEHNKKLDAQLIADLSNLYIRYITAVVLPYLSGDKDVDPAILLGLPKDALTSKKKQHNYVNETYDQ